MKVHSVVVGIIVLLGLVGFCHNLGIAQRSGYKKAGQSSGGTGTQPAASVVISGETIASSTIYDTNAAAHRIRFSPVPNVTIHDVYVKITIPEGAIWQEISEGTTYHSESRIYTLEKITSIPANSNNQVAAFFLVFSYFDATSITITVSGALTAGGQQYDFTTKQVLLDSIPLSRAPTDPDFIVSHKAISAPDGEEVIFFDVDGKKEARFHFDYILKNSKADALSLTISLWLPTSFSGHSISYVGNNPTGGSADVAAGTQTCESLFPQTESTTTFTTGAPTNYQGGSAIFVKCTLALANAEEKKIRIHGTSTLDNLPPEVEIVGFGLDATQLGKSGNSPYGFWLGHYPSGSGLSSGAISGIVIGIVLALIIIIGAIFYLRKKKQ